MCSWATLAHLRPSNGQNITENVGFWPSSGKLIPQSTSDLVYVQVRWVFRSYYIFSSHRPNFDPLVVDKWLKLVVSIYFKHGVHTGWGSLQNLLDYGHVGLISAFWWPSLYFHSLWLSLEGRGVSSNASLASTSCQTKSWVVIDLRCRNTHGTPLWCNACYFVMNAPWKVPCLDEHQSIHSGWDTVGSEDENHNDDASVNLNRNSNVGKISHFIGTICFCIA